MMTRLICSYFNFLIYYKLYAKSRALNCPRPTSTAQTSDFKFQRPSFTGGFQAEPSLNNTTVEEFREFQTHSRSNLKFYKQNNTQKLFSLNGFDACAKSAVV